MKSDDEKHGRPICRVDVSVLGMVTSLLSDLTMI